MATVNDNAKQECRELISTMADTFSVYLKYYAPSSSTIPLTGPHDAAEMFERERVLKASLEIFYSRLFIAEQLLKLKVRDRWIAALTEYEKNRNGQKFANDFGALTGEVRKIAQEFIA